MLNNRFVILLIFLFAIPVQGWPQESRELDRQKWRDIKESIRYGKGDKKGEGQRWTYSDVDWEKMQSEDKSSDQLTEERRVSQRSFSRRSQSSSSNSVNIDFGMSSGLATFFYILIAAALLSIIVYLVIKNYKKNPKVEKSAFEETLDKAPTEISLTELQQLLNRALENENYREAIRIYFIFILKELSDRNWIDWKKDKTNLSYLREMRKKSEFKLFKTTVNIFDVVWYGTDHLDKSSFDKFEPEMKKMHHKLGIR